MLELVKLVVDFLTKAIPGAASKRRTAKWAALGTQLFTFYTVCNQMLLRGERIVMLLEELTERGSILDSSKVRVSPEYVHVRSLISEQGTELIRVKQTIDEWAPHVQMLSGMAYNDLVMAVIGKHNRIQEVDRMIGRYGPIGQADDTELEVSSTIVSDEKAQYLLEDLQFMKSIRGLSPQDAFSGIGVHERERLIWSYLERRNPRSGLDLIRASLEQFRTEFLRVFQLEDILPRVEIGRDD